MSGQVNVDLNEKYFLNKLTEEGFENIKAGLMLSAVRNDTVFVLFFDRAFEKEILIPVGSLNNPDRNFSYSSMEHNFFRNIEGVHISSKTRATLIIKETDTIYIILQVLNWDHLMITDFNQLKEICSLERVLYYSWQRGIYNIEYSNLDSMSEKCIGLYWPYKEGDLYLD